jgi:hypothetical protein
MPVLLDARATALNQDDGHDDKEHAGNNPNDSCGFHGYSTFLQIALPSPLQGRNASDAS